MNQNGLPVNLSDADSAAGAHEYDRGRTGSRRPSNAPRAAAAASPAPAPTGPRPAFAIDAWSLLRPAARRWYWLLFAAVLGAIGGAVAGIAMFPIYYTAGSQMVQYEPPVATDAYRPMQIHGPTLVGMINSGEVFKSMANQMNPPASPGALAGRITAVPERQSAIVTVKATGHDPRSAIDLANLYMQEAIRYTQEHQRREANEADQYVKQHLEETRADLGPARKAFEALGPIAMLGSSAGAAPNTPAAVVNKTADRLQAAEAELDKLLVKYTDAHPAVKAQRAMVAQLQTELELQKKPLAEPARPGTNSSMRAPATREEWELLYVKLRELENLEGKLLLRQRAIETFKDNPPGNFKVMLPASVETVQKHEPWVKVALLAVFFGGLGMFFAAGEVLRREFVDTRIKTEADVGRVTGLPVLATLGDLRQMSLAERESWAFRTWIALQDRLAYSPNHGLICGITSSSSGDGRSTWISLLAGAARKCGFRVLTIATRPTAEMGGMDEAQEPVMAAAQAEAEAVAATARANGHAANGATATAAPPRAANGTKAGTRVPGTNGSSSTLLTHPNDLTRTTNFAGDSDFTALTASALFTPAMVTEKLMGTETDPLVHIPLPGWTWNLERRKQWQGALNVWRKIDNVVILVELPPASMPESVLLASNLPNLAWLVESNKSDAVHTRAQLQTLRHARCNLVGAFVNRAMTPVTQGRFSRWVGCLAMFGLLAFSAPDMLAQDVTVPAATAENTVAAAGPVGTFSIVSPTQRAGWQRKLTLGAGDVLTLGLYGEPELLREQVAIGPDGRISYLEANDIMAAGLTVDEFRDKLNLELGKFRRTPQALVSPVAYKSKKYFVLGRVAQRGAFPLDRPTTLLEAVARAGGMETGMASDRSLVELADLSRSFLARNGQRVPVDFQKLFLEGDLSQNIALEPNDYIFFPGGGEKEVYVLGAVRTPGPYAYQSNTGVIGAISARGGFSDRAWTKKLLVIRGGLGAPETFKVDALDVLSGRAPDVVLQPKDIVYVSDRPWIYAEELLDAAANAFVTSAVVIWTGEKITRDPR